MAKSLNRILVSLDGSANSLRGLRFALGVAKQSGSSVIGLNIHLPLASMKTSSTVRHKVKQKSKDIIKQAEMMAQNAKVPFSGVNKVSDNVGKTIVTFAENHKVDLIVIGTRGPDPEFEIFLGSVANHVIHKSKIPVTIVK